MIDLDRLHAVFDGKAQGPGCGKTLACAFDVAMGAVRQEREIWVVVDSEQDLDWTREAITRALRHYGLDFEWVQFTRCCVDHDFRDRNAYSDIRLVTYWGFMPGPGPKHLGSQISGQIVPMGRDSVPLSDSRPLGAVLRENRERVLESL